MKKKIIGVAMAALLFGGSIGYAASYSLVGAKVTGLFTLQHADNTKIADAVIINGSAYVPVRKMAEATGRELTVEGKTITIEPAKEMVLVISGDATQAQQTPTPSAAVTLTQAEREILQKRIANVERAIASTREDLANAQAKLSASTDEAEVQKLKQTIKELEARITAAQKSVEIDKTRLAADGQ